MRFLVNTHQFLQVLSKFGEGLHQTKNENGINNTAEDNPRGEVRNENGSVSSEEHTKTPHYLLLPDVDSAELSKMVEFQRSRLQECLRSIIRYIVKALLVPPSGMPPNIMPDNHIPGETNYYYVMMTIWYVARYFPRDSSSDWSRLWDYTRSIRKSLNLSAPSPLSSNGRLPPDNWSFQVTDKEKVSLLQWYHYGSILNLCNQGILDESWKDGPDLKWRVLRLAKAAKVTAASKLCSRLQYAADDEIIDRLSFVSDELGLEYLPDGQVGYVAMSAVKRVKSRDHTRLINPGWLPVGEEGPTSGPWEIHALCHHSRLIVLVLEKRAGQDHRTKQHTKEEADTVKQRIYGFLNAEGTLVPCWERAHAKARKGWLRSEATSVVATTLLLIQKKRIWDRINEPRAPASLSHSLSPPDANMSLRRMESITRDKSDFDSFDKNTNETGQLPPVAWETFRPPRLYHPKGFLNSLEDTPGLYKTDQLIKASIPASLSGFITAARDVVIPFTHKTLEEAVKGSLWLWDITATTPRQEEQGATWGIRPLHSDSDQAERERGDTGEEKQSRLGWVLYDNVSMIQYCNFFM